MVTTMNEDTDEAANSDKQSPLTPDRPTLSCAIDSDEEVNSTNYKEWIREHLAKDIGRGLAGFEETNYWNVVGFEED